MSSSPFILSIDQGTTSSRAILFDLDSQVVASCQQEFEQIFPDDGWVEHNPEDIWRSTLQSVKSVIEKSAAPADIVAIGITNQRETTLIWDRTTGKPLYNAIVWQDRRTARYCERLREQGLESQVSSKTGLLLDPYFSATKINWILDNVGDARKKAENGQLAFGTVDTFLIWRLTAGRCHLTDATNASRTLLYNIHSGEWDKELLQLFDIPESLLPQVRNCADEFGVTDASVLGREIPICGVAGDQQSALIGQACFKSGMVKSTFGTGCFMIMNTGDTPVRSSNRLLTTIAYQLDNETSYALEGSIFNAGTVIQWLRDGLEIIKSTDEMNRLPPETEPRSPGKLYLVPAFTGLGAPHWNPDSRGILTGITRDTTRSDLLRSALESVCYQTNDLITAMLADSGEEVREIRVDGGMTVNLRLLQSLADITQSIITQPTITQTTALGASYLAGLHQGLYQSLDAIAGKWKVDSIYKPEIDTAIRSVKVDGWNQAVARCLL